MATSEPIVLPTSDSYRSCTVIHPDGRTQKGNVAKVRLMSEHRAVETLKAGMIAWVAETDAESVIAAWRGHDDR